MLFISFCLVSYYCFKILIIFFVLFKLNCIINYFINSSERVAAGSSNPQNWEVVVGEHSQAGYDGTEQILQIDYIVKHNAFSIESKHKITTKLSHVLLALLEYTSQLKTVLHLYISHPSFNICVLVWVVVKYWYVFDIYPIFIDMGYGYGA